MQTKNRKERGEPGKIYHVRNVIGRENLITCEQTNEFAYAVRYEQIQSFSCDSFYMADYATLPGSTESYSEHTQTRIHSKITLTTRLPGKLTSRRMALKALLNAKAALS